MEDVGAHRSLVLSIETQDSSASKSPESAKNVELNTEGQDAGADPNTPTAAGSGSQDPVRKTDAERLRVQSTPSEAELAKAKAKTVIDSMYSYVKRLLVFFIYLFMQCLISTLLCCMVIIVYFIVQQM